MSKTATEIIKSMDGDDLFFDLNNISDYYDNKRKEMVREYDTLFAETKGDIEGRRKLKEERNKAFLELDNMQKRIAKAKVGIAQKDRKFLEFTEPEAQDILNLLKEHEARESKADGGLAHANLRFKNVAREQQNRLREQYIQDRAKNFRKFHREFLKRIQKQYGKTMSPEKIEAALEAALNPPQPLEPKRNREFEIGKRSFYQEGGDVDMQMSELMPAETEQQNMVPDMEMEEDYLDFILDEALTDEEEVMLETKLEQDEELAILFDKVIDVAQEFAGAGLVEGPGNGVSDSIPARLSDGEFVFTAKAAQEIGADTLMSVMKEAEAKADARQGMAVGGVAKEEVKPSPVFGTKVDESTIPSEINEGMVATNPLDPRHRYFQ
tara:strand:+ start:456 stop:1598 length:1143 start_codon:yes stop_codon:yes gene_type:complete